MSSSTGFSARAHSNIALIKYWGKANRELIIPTTSSLSLTLDAYWTDTTLIPADNDSVHLNGTQLTSAAAHRVVEFLDYARSMSGSDQKFQVVSQNHVPTAAGLASSASAFAALAVAVNLALELGLDQRGLSRLARRGSGSASRSIFGGFAKWNAGEDDLTSYAEPVASTLTNDIAMVAAVIDAGVKAVSSRTAMEHTMQTSPLYAAWVHQSASDLDLALEALAAGDLSTLGEIAEANQFGMHATMISARPAVLYWLPGTLAALDRIAKLRLDGVPVWATMDAGPNVKAICHRKDVEVVSKTLSLLPEVTSCTTAVSGPSAGQVAA